MKLPALVLFLVVSVGAQAQSNFRTNGIGGGNWNAIATWQVESPNGSNNWVAASSTPSYTSGTIQIQGNDIVTVSSPVTIDQTTIDANGTISVSNVQLKLINTASALVVNGTLSVTGGAGIINNSASSNIVFNSGSTYTHNRDSGIIPPAIWGTGSLCNITGFTNVTPTGFNPVGGFYKFIWNCQGQMGDAYLEGNLTTVASDLTVTTTNGRQLFFSSGPAGPTINIGGNLQIDGDSRIGIVTSGTDAIVNIAGDFNYNSTNATGSELKNAGSYTINVSGNFNINAPGGTLNFSRGNGTTGAMNLNGDFNLTAGTLTTTAGRGAINFNKGGTQQYINNGTIASTSTIDFTIGASTTLNMLAESSISGRGNLVVSGILRLGSTNSTGALTSDAATGNIRNTFANRIYNPGCKIVYAGTSAQVIGSGHPTISGVTTEINNASGVTFNTTATGNSGSMIILIPDDLILTSGNLNIVGSPTTATLARNLTLNGNVTANSNNVTFSGVNTSLIINGTGALGTFPTPITGQTIQNFTFNRASGSATFNQLTILGTATITNGTVTFGGTTSIGGNASLSSGTVMAFDGQSLSMAGNFTSSGLLSASGTSSLSLTGTNALTSPLNFVPTNNTLQNLTINISNTSGTSVQIGSSTLNVTNSLNLTDGFLDIANTLNMSNGSTINFNATGVNPSSITTNSPSGGPWNLNYTGTLGFTTGLEIPASGSLLSLSSSNSNISTAITLGQSLNIGSGGITINAGTFKCGANMVSTSSLTVNGGTFIAPSTTITLSGNLALNGGTYTNNSGTIAFGGTTTVSGAAAGGTNFYNVTINGGGILTPSATFNIQHDFVDNGSLAAGTGTVNFNSLVAQIVSGTTNSQFYNLTVNKGAGSLTINSPQTVTNNLTVAVGTLTISSTVSIPATGTVILTTGSLVNNANQLTLANGASITRAGGLITTSSPSGGPWNLTYTGASKTTSLEIPASGSLTNLTINTNNGTAISLAASQPLNVSGVITTNSGTTLNTFGNNVSVGSISNSGTLNAPSSVATVGLTLNGSLTNNGTFSAGTGTVLIGSAVSIIGTVPALNNLTINSGGALTAPTALTIQGNFQNNGSLVAGTGTVTFSGNTAKTITGTSKTIFNNLTVIDGTQAKDLSLETTAGADLKGILTMGASAVFDTDGASNNRVFTLLSTGDRPTSDASIAPLSSNAQLPGKITVQRYMSRIGVSQYNYQVWRNISSPVNTTVFDLQSSLPVTGPFANASVVSGADASSSSMVRYDETVTTDLNGDGFIDINDGWYDFPVASGNSQTTSFVRGVGYSLFIYGSDPPVSTNGNESFSLTGPIWNGTFDLPVTYTSTGDNSNDGWNLIGNPYPSAIDWNSAGWTKTNVDDAIYMDDYNGVQPIVASYVNGVSTNGGSNLIAIGQGFWVKANAASPLLTIQESVKAAGSQTTFFRQASPEKLLKVTLAQGGLKDETVIYFSEFSTTGFDSKYDALKFKNPQSHPNLSSLSGLSGSKEKYSINSMPYFNDAKIVPLDISSVTSGSYQLMFNGLESFPSSMNIQLKDKLTGSITDVRQNPTYVFDVDQHKSFTFGSSRFSIVFGGSGEEIPSIEVKAYPNPTRGHLTIEVPGDEASGQILNSLGANLGSLDFNNYGQKQIAQCNLANESNGFYFVKITQHNKITILRIIKE